MPAALLNDAEHAKNNLPDVLARWAQRAGSERARPRTAIEANGYDLSLNRYMEVVHDTVQHRAPADILAELGRLEGEIQRGTRELAGMVR